MVHGLFYKMYRYDMKAKDQMRAKFRCSKSHMFDVVRYCTTLNREEEKG